MSRKMEEYNDQETDKISKEMLGKEGRIIHLECHFMEEISHHIEKSHGFTLQCKNSILYGVCKECKNKFEE